MTDLSPALLRFGDVSVRLSVAFLFSIHEMDFLNLVI